MSVAVHDWQPETLEERPSGTHVDRGGQRADILCRADGKPIGRPIKRQWHEASGKILLVSSRRVFLRVAGSLWRDADPSLSEPQDRGERPTHLPDRLFKGERLCCRPHRRPAFHAACARRPRRQGNRARGSDAPCRRRDLQAREE